jgi:hypothetical protein
MKAETIHYFTRIKVILSGPGWKKIGVSYHEYLKNITIVENSYILSWVIQKSLELYVQAYIVYIMTWNH